MKKSIFAVLLMIVLGAAIFAQTEADFTVSANDDGTVTITKYTGWDTDIKIPSTINGKTVTAIGDRALENCDLTGAIIPDTVKTIGNSAFRGNKMTGITIGNGVISIGDEAFSKNLLTSVTIPGSVISIGKHTFFDNKLTSVTIPDSVTSIGFQAFYGHQLTSVTLGSLCGFANMFGDFVFYNYVCNDMQSGTYTGNTNWRTSSNTKEAEGFRYIETSYGLAITGYRGDQKRLSIPDSLNGKPVKYIEGLSGKGLTGLRIPDSVTSIGEQAFYRNQLTSVIIPNNVTYIGREAFNDNKLINVALSNSITSIGYQAFRDNQLTSITIPDGVAYIGAGAFFANQLTSVTVPVSVTAIGEGAFYGNKLTNVTIPENVQLVVSTYDSFGNRFGNFYNDNGKKAGIYTYAGSKWTYRAR